MRVTRAWDWYCVLGETQEDGVLEVCEGQTWFLSPLPFLRLPLCYLSQQLGGGRRQKPGCVTRNSCWPPVTHSAAVLGVVLPPCEFFSCLPAPSVSSGPTCGCLEEADTMAGSGMMALSSGDKRKCVVLLSAEGNSHRGLSLQA